MKTSTSKKRLGGSNSLPIPLDLVIEIFARLPAKSVARCRCLSKLWSSILHRPYFTELFLTRSSSFPQLLFSCRRDSNLFLFSAPHVRNSDIGVASYRIKFPFGDFSKLNLCGYSKLCGSIRGLVCFTYSCIKNERKEIVPVICNPRTRQYLTNLPKLMAKITDRQFPEVDGFHLYDPVDRQFKVLFTSRSGYQTLIGGNRILTLGTRKPSWRKVDCCSSLSSGVCINGFLYYVAAESSGSTMIVCFDVRYEKFSFIKGDEDMILSKHSVLVNYNGKLGTLSPDDDGYLSSAVTRRTTSFQMWVLENSEKSEWSKLVYELPSMLENVFGNAELYFVGVVGTKEIVLARRFVSVPFYVFYYNLESKTIRRVEIQGLDAFKNWLVNTSVDYVEDVKLMDLPNTYNLRQS